MSFTPITADETAQIRASKKAAASELADCFFTYAFAFILCFSPAVSLHIVIRALSLLFELPFFVYLLPPPLYALGFRGLKAFIHEFYFSRKRRFYVIYETAFCRPLCYLRASALTLLLTSLPSLLIYFLPFLLNVGRSLRLACELLSIAAFLGGICFAVSIALFGKLKPINLRFVSSFLFQLLLSCLTSGAWLIVAVPYVILSALIYTKPK